MIAADCYRTGQFYYAAKAYDVLERLDPSPEYWEGKRGACIGWFQRIIAEKGAFWSLENAQRGFRSFLTCSQEPRDSLTDLILMLRNTNNREVDYLVMTMNNWAKENGANLDY